MIKYTNLKLTGYPALRDRLRIEYRKNRGATKVCCCCQRQLNYIESSWVAVRGIGKLDYMVCMWCDEELVEMLKNDLHTEKYDTLLIIQIEGSELFI